MRRLSEASLTEVFRQLLGEGIPGLPRMTYVGNEIATPFGVVDVATLDWGAEPMEALLAPSAVTVLGEPGVDRIMAALKPAAPRTLGYLGSATTLPIGVVGRLMSDMEDVGLVSSSGSAFTFGPALSGGTPTLSAFELKIEHWRRAQHQALRYRMFAHRVAIVMPLPWAQNAIQQRAQFAATGIGVLSVDTVAMVARWLLRPRTRTPASSRQYWATIGRFLRAA